MVLANKIALLLLIAIFGVACRASEKSNCSLKDATTIYEAQDGTWLPESKLVSGKVMKGPYPVTGIKVYEGSVWMSTHHSDYSPVKLVVVNELVDVKGIRFLYAPDHMQSNSDVNYVRPYSRPEVRYALELNCLKLDKLRLNIYIKEMSGLPDEVIVFSRSR